jgi:hypothetical protein
MADYLAERGTSVIQIWSCKLPFHFEKLRIKRNIQDFKLLLHWKPAQTLKQNSWEQSTIHNFPWGDVVVSFRLFTSHGCSATELYWLNLYIPIVCLVQKVNSILNQDHLPDITVLKWGIFHHLQNYIGMVYGEWNSSKCRSIEWYYRYYYYCILK